MSPKILPILLFDLDGTLIDSHGDIAVALNKVITEEGAPALTMEAITAMVGDGARKLVERGLAASGLELDAATRTARFLEFYGQSPTALTRPYPGVPETLEILKSKGFKMAVCTNKPQAPSEQILANLGLDGFFEFVAGGDRFTVRKPEAGHLTGTLEAMGQANQSAVMIGDSVNDLLSAQNAGLPAIWCRFGYGDRRCEPLPKAAEIHSFSEILELPLASLSL